ncbi:MAG: histone acetyltransferase [Watsoniomyces obsoletus]|nr:MAG: histone acetyltransferase [Watsoniomyces obsoletus]
MDPVQARARDALEPYVRLAPSATSPRAAVDLIVQATSNANTFIFAELLETSKIQALRDAEPRYSCYLTQLELFAWGTWQEYHATPNLPPLNEQQHYKLRMLSLLTLCRDPANLTYTNLQSALALSTARALEDVVIGANNAGLITARLSPSTSLVHVSSIAPLRDLRPGAVGNLLDALTAWDVRCGSVLREIDVQVKELRRKAVTRRKEEEEYQKMLEKNSSHQSGGADKLGGGSKRAAADGVGSSQDDGDEAMVMGEDMMDLDDSWVATAMSMGQADGPADARAGQPRKNARAKTGGLGRR